jgi:hypothetical protein
MHADKNSKARQKLSFQEQANMIRHQDIVMHFPATALTNLCQAEEKAFSILIIEEKFVSPHLHVLLHDT